MSRPPTPPARGAGRPRGAPLRHACAAATQRPLQPSRRSEHLQDLVERLPAHGAGLLRGSQLLRAVGAAAAVAGAAVHERHGGGRGQADDAGALVLVRRLGAAVQLRGRGPQSVLI